MNPPSLPIAFAAGLSDERRQRLIQQSADLGIELASQCETSLELLADEQGLSMRCADVDQRAWVSIDLAAGAARHRRHYGGGKSQALARALGLDQKKGLEVIDATAGLAADSFVLASLGARVCMLERSPALALMIADALELASGEPAEEDAELAGILARMRLIHTDACEWLAQQPDASTDLVYLDPMFPERRKKAAVKKEMQLLQALLRPGSADIVAREVEEAELLSQALRVARFRVAVKRPRHAPVLPGVKPGYCLEGKSTRFDVYPKRTLSAATGSV